MPFHSVPLWASIPFAAMLLSIAVLPLVNHDWWERHYPHVTIGLGFTTITAYVLMFDHPERLMHTGLDYFAFMALLGSLFVVSGGILIRIEGAVTPLTNTSLLLVGAIISNLLGTTGASMLLIRPYLHINRDRMKPYLAVFFIFIVSNVGGALTPIGDPPLFLGYLKGVPFFWIIGRLWHVWLLAVGLLLAAFLFFDYRNHKGVKKTHAHGSSRIVVTGWYNLVFLGLIILAVFKPTPLREFMMLGAAAASYFLTPKSVHRGHDFTFHPIVEVAVLFFGIFATMMPALDWLEANAHMVATGAPGAFYWATGTLSSFLDNAPTYLSFLYALMGLKKLDVAGLLLHAPLYIVAISLGSVFFGAMTYIGNGPNFMIKAIAHRAGVKMPTFFGYMLRYSIPILLPILFLVWLLFLL